MRLEVDFFVNQSISYQPFNGNPLIYEIKTNWHYQDLKKHGFCQFLWILQMSISSLFILEVLFGQII